MFLPELVSLGTFLGMWEIIIVALVILVLFGATKIPTFMRSLGQGINEFKKASKGEGDESCSTSKPTTSPDEEKTKEE